MLLTAALTAARFFLWFAGLLAVWTTPLRRDDDKIDDSNHHDYRLQYYLTSTRSLVNKLISISVSCCCGTSKYSTHTTTFIRSTVKELERTRRLLL